MQSEFVCDFCCIHRVRQVLREGRRVIFCPAHWEEAVLIISFTANSKLRALGASLCEKLSGLLPCSSYFPYTDRSPKGLTPQSKAHIMEYFSSENRSETDDIWIKSSTPSAINYNCVQFKGRFIHFLLWKHFLQLYLWFKLNFYHKIVLASVLFLFIVPLSCS